MSSSSSSGRGLSSLSDRKINRLDSFELNPHLFFTKSFFLTSDSLVAETKSCLHLNFYSCCCCRRHCYTLNSVDHSPSSSLQPWFYCIRTAELISMNSIFVFGGGTNNHRRASCCCWCSYWTVASMAFMQKAVIANFQVITDTSTLGPLYADCSYWL